LFQKYFEFSQETTFQRGTGRWDGSASFIPDLIKTDNPSCHGEENMSQKEKSKRGGSAMFPQKHLGIDEIIICCQENCFITKHQPMGDGM